MAVMFTPEYVKDIYKKHIFKYLNREIEKDPKVLEACGRDDKNLEDLMTYIRQNAKKEIKDGVAIIEDKKVYQWTREYLLGPEDTSDMTQGELF